MEVKETAETPSASKVWRPANGLVDCGSAIVHIMQPALRAYYNLEELWGGHPVRMKLLEDENKEDSE